MDEDNSKKDIEVVEGMGNLDISPVFDNTTSAKPKMKDEMPTNIVVPQVKKGIKEKEDDDNKDEDDNLDSIDDNKIEYDDIELDSDNNSETENK